LIVAGVFLIGIAWSILKRGFRRTGGDAEVYELAEPD
jgi:hypothetical protein